MTEQRRIERELRETAAKFQALAEQIPAVTYIERLKGPVHLLYVSPQYLPMFGYTAEERIADPDLWPRLLHPEDRERVLAVAGEIQAEDGGWSLEYRMVHRDGHTVWVRDQAVLVRDPDGEPMFWQGVLFDITESKLAERELQQALERERSTSERLRQADEIKNTFLRAVSHDLRSPLTAILGSAITLEQEDALGLPPETRQELAHGLAQKARKLTAIVADLLDMDRLTRGLLEPRLVPVDIGGLVHRVVRETEALEGRTAHVEANPVTIAVDASMVERIIENLLGNAVKHTTPTAAIWIRLLVGPDGIVLAVEDDGPGVPEHLRESVFGAFQRGTADATPGLGLGLSIVARFAELHGGRAWVEEREGGGASFRVLLPYRPRG